jgi:hypothetical protein
MSGDAESIASEMAWPRRAIRRSDRMIRTQRRRASPPYPARPCAAHYREPESDDALEAFAFKTAMNAEAAANLGSHAAALRTLEASREDWRFATPGLWRPAVTYPSSGAA